MSDGALYGPFTVASGPQGVPGPGLTHCGDWDGAANYNPGDVAAYNDNLYAAFDTANGIPPDSDPRWRLLSITGAASSPGAAGERGEKGEKGDAGEAGPAGPAGEVTAVQLAQEISFAFGGTSANSNTVQPLALTVSDPPTQSEMQAIANKLDEVIAAPRR
jgi:hypothetical protein